jgi:uncharacterized protein YjbJ (UPF0337 family)
MTAGNVSAGPGRGLLKIPGLTVSKEKGKGERQMKSSTKNQIKGKFHELKGNVKEKAGQVTNNPTLAAEGRDETLAGKVQKKVGQIEEVLEK